MLFQQSFSTDSISHKQRLYRSFCIRIISTNFPSTAVFCRSDLSPGSFVPISFYASFLPIFCQRSFSTDPIPHTVSICLIPIPCTDISQRSFSIGSVPHKHRLYQSRRYPYFQRSFSTDPAPHRERFYYSRWCANFLLRIVSIDLSPTLVFHRSDLSSGSFRLPIPLFLTVLYTLYRSDPSQARLLPIRLYRSHLKQSFIPIRLYRSFFTGHTDRFPTTVPTDPIPHKHRFYRLCLPILLGFEAFLPIFSQRPSSTNPIPAKHRSYRFLCTDIFQTAVFYRFDASQAHSFYRSFCTDPLWRILYTDIFPTVVSYQFDSS